MTEKLISYKHQFPIIEKQAAAFWLSENVNLTENSSEKSKKYILAMFPYPSGDAHLGHVRVYSISDTMARIARFKGYNVLHPLGWDAFGLPAENTAIQNNLHPAKWVKENIDKMRNEQLGELGFSFDFSHEINTASPEYYKWTQWLFIQLYNSGLVYRSHEWVNWDPVDKTVLANEQVIDGKGWRSGAAIERCKMEQWNIRITDFAEDLWNGLDSLDEWPEMAIAAQRHWIGRSTGAIITFKVIESERLNIDVFSTHPETIYGVSAIVLAPEHALVPELTLKDKKAEVQNYINLCVKLSDVDRESNKDKSSIFLGTYALHPLTHQKIPLYIANYVLPVHGTGAIMAVPAHDERDFEFATKYSLPIIAVISKNGEEEEEITSAYLEDGIMKNSDNFNGKRSEDVRNNIISYFEEKGIGRKSVQYRLRDWSISRQRFWGAPIPMRKDTKGEWSPIPEDQLPVILPDEVDFSQTDGKSPLAKNSKFYHYKDLNSGEEYTRETDTMDTFMCSSWYIWRFLDPLNKEEAWSPKKANIWMPLDIYVGGLEHANQHMIYLRFISYFLFSRGMTPVKEPIKRFLSNGMVRLDGFKMSKSKGNIVRPDEMIRKYGADALRLYILSDTPFERPIDWNEDGLKSKHDFLGRIYSLYQSMATQLPKGIISLPNQVNNIRSRGLLHSFSELLEAIDIEVEKLQKFHVMVAQIHSFFNELSVYSKNKIFDTEDVKVLGYVMQNFLKVVGLTAPHISEILWREIFGLEKSIFKEAWPKIDTFFFESKNKKTEIAVMVNGKKKFNININSTETDAAITNIIHSDDILVKLGNPLIQKIIVVRDHTHSNMPKLVNVVV